MTTSQTGKRKNIFEIEGIVSKIIQETADTHTIRITIPERNDDQGEFTFKPGQFVMVKPEINGKKIPRAYSISSSPTKVLSGNYYIDNQKCEVDEYEGKN